MEGLGTSWDGLGASLERPKGDSKKKEWSVVPQVIIPYGAATQRLVVIGDDDHFKGEKGLQSQVGGPRSWPEGVGAS